MSVERWNDDRLDRLADSVAANTRNIAAMQSATRELQSATRELQSATSQLISAMQDQQEGNTQIFQALIQEIRGLRAENRRILIHLFGEQSE